MVIPRSCTDSLILLISIHSRQLLCLQSQVSFNTLFSLSSFRNKPRISSLSPHLRLTVYRITASEYDFSLADDDGPATVIPPISVSSFPFCFFGIVVRGDFRGLRSYHEGVGVAIDFRWTIVGVDLGGEMVMSEEGVERSDKVSSSERGALGSGTSEVGSMSLAVRSLMSVRKIGEMSSFC